MNDLTIPDIYNIEQKKEIVDNIEIDIQTYNFKSFEKKTYIDQNALKKIKIILFETENNKIYFNGTKIWNKKIFFCNRGGIVPSICNLVNMSNDDAILKLYIITYKNYHTNISYLGNQRCEINKKKEFYEKFNLCTIYCGITIITTIFLECYKELTNKIISIQSFNIICFYKVKLISKNNTYNYVLTLCGIQNTLLDEYIDINLKYDNIYDIYNVYYVAFSKILKFFQNDIKHIITHNIELSEDIRDPDGYNYNVFHSFDSLNFMKKYNVSTINTYRYGTIC
jgi:hypothetical protein